MTADFRDLQIRLRHWDDRRRRQEMLRRLPLGLLLGLLLGLVVALLSRARPWQTREEAALIALLLAVVAVVLTALILLLRRRPLTEQARFADRQFGLRERMITAVEIAAGQLPADPPVADRQLRDALDAARGVDLERQLPLAFRPSDWLPPLAVLALLALVLWLPNPMEAILLEQRAVAAAIEEQAANLAKLADEIATDENLTAEQRETLQQPIDEALAALSEPGMSREAAVAALSAAEAELRQLGRESDPEALSRALAEAAAALAGSEAATELAEALAGGDPAQGAAAAAALADSLDGLTPSSRAELAGGLAESAEALRSADEAAAQALAEAAAALAEGDTAMAAEALNEAAAALAEAAAAGAVAARATATADQLDTARQALAQAGAGEQGGEAAGEQTGSEATSPDGAGTGAGEEAGAGAPAEGGGHVESVFVPPPVDLEGQGEALELDVQCLDGSEACGPVGNRPSPLSPEPGAGSFVPYQQVLGDYRNAAFEALTTGDIPLRLQGLVRDYFSALEP